MICSSPVRSCVMTLTILGITSPLRKIITLSPNRISLRWISSKLCNVERSTVTPSISTGSTMATGVTTPLRPTWSITSLSLVSFSMAGNLYAEAHRGFLTV